MDQQSIFKSLETAGPEAWLAYLQPFEAGEPLDGLSMQVIFHYAAPLAKKEASLDWAEVAIRAAELEARSPNDIVREESLLNAMNLRSWFISRLGSRPGHFVLDKEIILHWVMDGLKVQIQTAQEQARLFGENLARAKNSPNPEDLRQMGRELSQLRWIKHRLNTVKVLADCGELPSDRVLHEWLQLRELLP
ncbi:MAG: hypothetical protein ABSH09_33560 [Bryobacteraceae bacterium]|jgi:hypothetical protein